jgi:uncharacterized protein involved in cysteine biosynthesis
MSDVEPTPAPVPAGSAVAGFRLPFEGARLLLRERRLWGPALVPFLLSLAAFAIAVGGVVTWAGELHGWATAWLPELEAQRWYAWLWVGPARALLAAFGALLFLALAAVCLVVAYLLASILAAPFHDVLAARVERVVTGGLVDLSPPGMRGLLREALRSVLEELRRMAFLAAVIVPLSGIGLVIPGAQAFCGPAILGFTIFFLPLDYTSYTLDRRRWAFREKRRWMLSRAPLMAGFGSAAFLACAVPLLNLIAMPLLVVAGTLLAVRYAPVSPEAATPGGTAPSS